MRLRHDRKGLALLASLALLLTSAGSLLAFNPTPAQNELEIPLQEFEFRTYMTPAIEAARADAEVSFASRNGGIWKVYSWNPQTGTPAYLYGSGVQVAPSFATDATLIETALQVIRDNPGVFRANQANLRLQTVARGAGKAAVHFQQTYHGIDVWNGRVHLTFTEAGRLFVLGSDYHPGIDVDPNPSIPAAVAQEIASAAVPFNPATDRLDGEAVLLVLPVPVGETEVDDRLVWRVRVRTEDPLGIWVTHVDAHSGEIVWRYNDIHFVDFVGTAEGDIQRPSYCEGQAHEMLPYLRIQVSGVGNTNADENGNWSLSYGGTDPHTVTADLYSNYVDLNNIAGAEGTFTGTATPGIPLAVNFTDLNSQRDEKDVYRAVNDIHDFFQIFAPEFPYANARITANVSRPSTCNAYWDGTINFYIEGGGCANTGEIMGVVHHEFGHGVQDEILGFQGYEGLGEGNSDILLNLMVRESIIGRGFYLNNCTSGIRNSLNSLQYPEDLNGQVHHDGQIIAGFNWDAMEVLSQDHGDDEGVLIAATNWHYGRVLEHPTYQPDQVLATFVADDDDGDLTNGTPHYDAICVGATNHGFDCPIVLVGVIIRHEPLGSRTEEGEATAIAEIYSTEGALLADSVRVHYRINGGSFQDVLMTPTGGDNEYAGTISGLQTLDEIEYYLRARDEFGNVRNDPEMAPEELHAFSVATLVDKMEENTGWQVNLEGGDNATTGIWTRVDPNGTRYGGEQIQPEDDHSPAPGTMCWVTGQGSPDGPAGEQDVDGGTTTLYSAVYDLTGSSIAKVKYYRWWTDDLGINAGDDTWRVQVRNNGGAWVDVENTGDALNDWVLPAFDLVAHFGSGLGQVQFKFTAVDQGVNSLVEAAVDDFEILASMSTAVPGEPSATPVYALMGSRPNPARDGTTIHFQVPVRSEVRVGIYDVGGRLVRSLAEGAFEAGVHLIPWDGRDSAGHEAPSGVYFYRLQANEYTATRSLVLTR